MSGLCKSLYLYDIFTDWYKNWYMIGTKIRTSYSVTMVLHSPTYVRLSARIDKNEFTKLTPNKNRKNVLKYQSHSPCLFINNQIPSLFYLCLFCKKFFVISLNICYLFCSQIHKSLLSIEQLESCTYIILVSFWVIE